MTSEDRMREFFSVFPAELPELRKAFIRHLDSHAAEARSDNREMCADAIALINATKVSEWNEITCSNVNGKNWFDLRDEIINATGDAEE